MILGCNFNCCGGYLLGVFVGCDGGCFGVIGWGCRSLLVNC